MMLSYKLNVKKIKGKFEILFTYMMSIIFFSSSPEEE